MNINKQFSAKIKEISEELPYKPLVHFNLSTKELLFYTIIGILLCPIFLSVVHETGHAIAVILFGGTVNEMSIFPASIFTNNSAYGGYIYWSAENISTLQITIIAMMGSLSTAFFGIIIFIIGFKLSLRPVIELWAFLYAIIFILDIVTYVISDSFGMLVPSVTDTNGDWAFVFMSYPFLIYILIPIVILAIVLLIRTIFHPKIFTRFTF